MDLTRKNMFFPDDELKPLEGYEDSCDNNDVCPSIANTHLPYGGYVRIWQVGRDEQGGYGDMDAKYTITLHGNFGEFGDGEEEVFAATNDWEEAKEKAAQAEKICNVLGMSTCLQNHATEKDNLRHTVSEFAMTHYKPVEGTSTRGEFDIQLAKYLLEEKRLPDKKVKEAIQTCSAYAQIWQRKDEPNKYCKRVMREAKARSAGR